MKEIIIFIIATIGVIWGFGQINTLENADQNFNEYCSGYTNVVNGGHYFRGKCYIDSFDSYETNEVCRGGLLGIGMSCYESKNTYTKTYRTTECYISETGERC